MTFQVIHLSDAAYDASFTEQATKVHVVCAGDSITGWNNFGRAESWPFPTYPEFLQQCCEPLDLQVAEGGVAGEISDNGLHHVSDYLSRFPNARYFIIGFGTNDLGMNPDLESASARILDNYAAMIEAVRSAGRTPLLLNVPNANECRFSPTVVADLRRRRDYHNSQLAAFCETQNVPLVDVRTHLRDEHFGDELHPNRDGAKVIADHVFELLRQVHAAE